MRKLALISMLFLIAFAVGCGKEKSQPGPVATAPPTNPAPTTPPPAAAAPADPTPSNPTPEIKNLGMIGLKSNWGAYLQAHTDGEMHASNPKRNQEETWFLISVDPGNKIYALANWRTGNFLNKKVDTDQCWANSAILGKEGQWQMVNGKPYGKLNSIAFKSVLDGTYMGYNKPGDDTGGGGEVSTYASIAESGQGSRGWWVMEAATTPEPGKDFWNTVGGELNKQGQKILNNLSPADIAKIISML